MAEYSKTTYNFNNRITLNDDTTDTTKFVLVGVNSIADTLALNVEQERPEEPGIVDFGVKLSKGSIKIPLTLFATTESNMAQLTQNLKEAFNPDLLEADATYGETTFFNGYHPLDWTETVGGTSRDFRIYVKSEEIPQVPLDSLSGLIRESELKLKANQPLKFTQAQSEVTTDGGTANNVGTYPTPVEITITASGATSTDFQVGATGAGGGSIYLAKALSSGQVLTIDTRHHSCKLDGTEDRSYIQDGSKWWTLSPGNNTIIFENDANATISVKWRSAWPI